MICPICNKDFLRLSTHLCTASDDCHKKFLEEQKQVILESLKKRKSISVLSRETFLSKNAIYVIARDIDVDLEDYRRKSISKARTKRENI